MSLRARIETCDALLRSQLDQDERVIAVGRCEDITERGDIEQGGAAWTYAMVTDRRLRWVPGTNAKLQTALDFDDVRSVRERSSKHRYALTLKHAPVTRPSWTHAHRFLSFTWGDKIVVAPRTRTVLAFSRRETAVAVAIRERLARLST
jgi:hypothetical protein